MHAENAQWFWDPTQKSFGERENKCSGENILFLYNIEGITF